MPSADDPGPRIPNKLSRNNQSSNTADELRNLLFEHVRRVTPHLLRHLFGFKGHTSGHLCQIALLHFSSEQQGRKSVALSQHGPCKRHCNVPQQCHCNVPRRQICLPSCRNGAFVCAHPVPAWSSTCMEGEEQQMFSEVNMLMAEVWTGSYGNCHDRGSGCARSRYLLLGFCGRVQPVHSAPGRNKVIAHRVKSCLESAMDKTWQTAKRGAWT